MFMPKNLLLLAQKKSKSEMELLLKQDPVLVLEFGQAFLVG